MPADNPTDVFDDHDAEAALARSMNPPVWDTPDDDPVMASRSYAIQTPPTHRHPIQTVRRRDHATPNGLAFLDLEAAVDDHNAGNEQEAGGSETDNSMEGAIDSRNFLIIQLETLWTGFIASDGDDSDDLATRPFSRTGSTPAVASTTPFTPSGLAPFSHTAIDRTARLDEVEDAFSTATLIQERYNTERPPSTTLSEHSEMEVAYLAYRQPTVEDTGLWRVSVKVHHNTPVISMGP